MGPVSGEERGGMMAPKTVRDASGHHGATGAPC